MQVLGATASTKCPPKMSGGCETYWRNPVQHLADFCQRHGPCALELFSGSGHFAQSFRQAAHVHGLAIFEWDIKWSSQHDLLSSKVQAKVRGWVRGGLVRLVWMGTPCTTFTTMQNMRRGGPLRTEKFPDGVVGLPPHQQAAVTAGNSFLRFSASILSICRRAHIPAIVENPHASGLWRHPVLAPVWKWKETKQFVVDYCAYGTPWRKRTRLLAVWADLSQSSRRCQGSCGMCPSPASHM